MVRFLSYAVLRSLYPLLALGAIWGSLLWGPWLSLPLAIVMLHLGTYVERWTGPSPPDLVTAPSWFGRWLAHPEDAHGLLFCGLCFAAIGSAFWLWLHPEATGFVTPGQKLGFVLGAGMWLGWCGGINMGVNLHSHAHKPIFKSDALNRWFGRLWTVPGGIPSYWWRYKHLAVHHSHLGDDDRDWVQPSGGPTAATRTCGSTSCCTGPGAGATTSRMRCGMRRPRSGAAFSGNSSCSRCLFRSPSSSTLGWPSAVAFPSLGRRHDRHGDGHVRPARTSTASAARRPSSPISST